MEPKESDMPSEPFITSDHGSTPSDRSTRNNLSEPPATQIYRSTFVVWLVFFYAALVLFPWVVICKLTYQPITVDNYGISNSYHNDGWKRSPQYAYDLYIQNERWYKAARVVQSATNLLTIPLTSAVCSSAVVVYLQHCTSKNAPNFTLRHMTVLANKGWADIRTFRQLVTASWPRYISSFLIWAIFLHLLGSIISPLQQILVSTETIKIPLYPNQAFPLMDIPDRFKVVNSPGLDPDSTIAVTRKNLESTSAYDYSSQLWTADVNCTHVEGMIYQNSELCSQRRSTWGNVSFLIDPFIAELPRSFNTGLVQQFLPRINSTAQYVNITAAEFPSNCSTAPGALSITHSNVITDMPNSTWAIQACMPADLRLSPWKKTRARQDFTETLYLNVSISDEMYHSMVVGNDTGPTSTYFRITVDTTAGYFELPNYMNGQKAGPLLDNDPNDKCGDACIKQGMENNIYDHKGQQEVKRRQEDILPANVDDLGLVSNKGPLLTTTLALFGPGSWIDTVNRLPALYDDRNITQNATIGCIDVAPLGRILEGQLLHGIIDAQINPINTCIREGTLSQSESTAPGRDNAIRAAEWVWNFRLGSISDKGAQTLGNAFTVAAYLANAAWMSAWMSPSSKNLDTLTVTYDLGANSQKPSISLASIIVISVLIAIDLLGLLATALYASWFPRWTGSLDAFSLLRLGSSISEHITLKISSDDDAIDILDQLPGWVGDDTSGDEIGRIALGGTGRLQAKMNYEAYDTSTVRERHTLVT